VTFGGIYFRQCTSDGSTSGGVPVCDPVPQVAGYGSVQGTVSSDGKTVTARCDLHGTTQDVALSGGVNGKNIMASQPVGGPPPSGWEGITSGTPSSSNPFTVIVECEPQ
jgi:hypothetical protein